MAEAQEAEGSRKGSEMRRASLPANITIGHEGQDAQAGTRTGSRRGSLVRSASLPANRPIDHEGHDAGGRSPKGSRRGYWVREASLPAIMPIAPEDHDAWAQTPEGSRGSSLMRSASLPAIMPKDPDEQDAWAIQTYRPELEIIETKETYIALEHQTALFACKINNELKPTCTWHRNGTQIYNDDRTVIINDGEFQQLHIKNVRISDIGLYILECRHLDYHINVHQRLFVCPKKIHYGAFHLKQKYFKTGVRKHLINTREYEGQTINLVAIFAFEATYIWYKNNEELHPNRRMRMTKNGRRASLTLTDAAMIDTGIYYVVANTSYGYYSSFANVVIGKPHEKIPILPLFEEHPQEEVDGYVGEEIRICAKVQIDANSMIKWGRNNETIIGNHEVQQIDYGNNYIGLRIPYPKISSAGDYQLLIANSQIPVIIGANIRLTVTEPPPPLLNEIRVLRQLESAVACCGAQISFDCSFELVDSNYFFVVWHVAHYTFERSNSLFTVISGKNQYILYIKSFEPCMAGDVICELRRSYPNHASVKVQRSYASLTCVPPCVIKEGKDNDWWLTSKLVMSSILSPSALYVHEFDSSKDDVSPTEGPSWRERLRTFCTMGLTLGCGPNRSFSLDNQDAPTEDFVLKIVLCKLDDEGLYFLNTMNHSRDPDRVTRFIISETPDDEPSTLLKWKDKKASPQLYYRLEMLTENGANAFVGITSRTSFSVFDLPIERVLVFRITEERPMLRTEPETMITIIPPSDEVRLNSLVTLQVIQSEFDFKNTFTKTDYNIGAGAFGCVTLVRNKSDNKEYAAKVVKARTGKRNEKIFREYEIMKMLSHPKIIKLYGFYHITLSYVFVMEYCWGGELFDRVAAEEHMREVDVLQYVRQICQALSYLSRMGIVHLDIKPENILCTSPNSTNVKIIDFGVARRLTQETPRVVYGTREYVAPEVLDFNDISEWTDMWSVGVVTYVLLSGLLPFGGRDWYERSFNIGTVRYDYADEAFDEISDLAKDFIDNLLIRRPESRMTADEALSHMWLSEGPPRGTGARRMTTMRKNLKSYLMEYKRQWQRVGNVMIAARRLRMLVDPKDLHEKNTPSLAIL